jgi:hypothetical protein
MRKKVIEYRYSDHKPTKAMLHADLDPWIKLQEDVRWVERRDLVKDMLVHSVEELGPYDPIIILDPISSTMVPLIYEWHDQEKEVVIVVSHPSLTKPFELPRNVHVYPTANQLFIDQIVKSVMVLLDWTYL